MKRQSERTKHTMEFEVERGNSSVTYEVDFAVTPGEKERGPTYDCGGTPASAPEVEDVEVYYVRVKRCEEHRFMLSPPRCKACKKVREPRPEMNDLVTEAELLEHAGETSDLDEGPEREDPDDARDSALDRERDSRDRDE